MFGLAFPIIIKEMKGRKKEWRERKEKRREMLDLNPHSSSLSCVIKDIF